MRFAGSGIDFTPQSLQSAGGGSNYSAAADVVDVGESFGAQRAKAPKYDQISAYAMETQSAEKRAAMEAEASVTGQGLAAFGQTKGSALQAQGAIEAAKAQADATKSSAMMGGIAKIASAGIGLIPGLSDERTKTAITPIDSALTALRELKPVTFYYKPEYGDHTRQHHGFVAQEFRKVLPDATYESSEGVLSIDPIDVIGLLVRANQELESRITRLEATNALVGVK